MLRTVDSTQSLFQYTKDPTLYQYPTIDYVQAPINGFAGVQDCLRHIVYGINDIELDHRLIATWVWSVLIAIHRVSLTFCLVNHTACRQALVLPPLLLIAVKERNEASLVPLPDFQVDMRTLISALTIRSPPINIHARITRQGISSRNHNYICSRVSVARQNSSIP